MAMNGQEVLRRKRSGGQNGNKLIIMFAERAAAILTGNQAPSEADGGKEPLACWVSCETTEEKNSHQLRRFQPRRPFWLLVNVERRNEFFKRMKIKKKNTSTKLENLVSCGIQPLVLS